MIKRTTILSAALAASAALALSAPARAADHIAVIEHPTDEKTIDIGAKGDSMGDLLVFANPLFDAANKTKVGTDQGSCVRTIPGKSWECLWTNTLKDGNIMVEGPFSDAATDDVFAVIGGTGKYAGARGTLKLHIRDEKNYDFVFDLQ
jgi:allene oxide cyclase